MHDLIEQMGREIVRRESIKDLGRRSRLSDHEDVYNVLNNNKGTDSVEGIMLDLSQIKRDLHLDADTFKRMPNIRFLKFYYSWRLKKSASVYVSSTLESFPNELRYLDWSGCPVKSLPPTFCAEKLIELCMPCSQVTKLWDGVQDLVNLKRINLRGCKQLVELPDFTQASNLEKVYLDDCARLRQLHPSILSIHKLETLSVYNCEELKSLKGKVHLKSLKTLGVRYCSSLKEFSVSSEELTSLSFDGTIIDTLHSSVGRLSKLVECDLSNVRLETLPNELCLLTSLG
ncbi:putative disease resistance protein At4g11170 [Arachis stenosperma]|uniref:putative disease resistance protein At4g11170 n=1 Tax=Arachis stenosperma TaxID=217475 RepID=UPI0025ABE4DF|nr:putative disease resistance protein At4g11170 [Arachis stenosperma]